MHCSSTGFTLWEEVIMYERGMVVVVICLFIGSNVASSISSDIKQFDTDVKEENINFLGSTSGIKMYTFNPTDDAYIDKSNPNLPHGAGDYYDHMMIRNAYGKNDSDIYQIDGLVKFDISSISQDEEILSATLNLYYYRGENSPANRDLNLYKVTSNWFEDTVMWDNQPSNISQPTSFATVPNKYSWMTWDVTSDVLDFVNKTVDNHGWKITDGTYYGADNIPTTYFRTKEHGDHVPYLEIKILPPADIYVDDDSECPGDGTKECPYCEIQYAIDNATEGNTIFVYNGEYYENLLINKSINLIGEHRNITVVRGVVNITSDDVTIESFTLEGGCIEILKRNNIAFYNNTFLCTNSYNFDISYSHDITIKNCNISSEDGKKANINLDATKYVLIDSNNFFSSGVSEYGIKIYYSENDTVSNNIFSNSYKNVTHMDSCKFCNILENKFFSDVKYCDHIFNIINLEECNWNTIKGNKLSYMYMPPIAADPTKVAYNINYFIRLSHSNDNWILNNTIKGPLISKYHSTKDHTYADNFVIANILSLFISPSPQYGKVKDQGYGIRLIGSNANKVKYNEITGVKVGISIAQSKGDIVAWNNVKDCYQFGLHLTSTTYNLFVYNKIERNYVAAIVDRGYMDYFCLNDFLFGGDGTPEMIFQFYSAFMAGSTIRGCFNYWDSNLGPFLRIW